MKITRRELVKLGASGAALWICGGARRRQMTLVSTPVEKIPIGLELCSVRDLCQKDLPGVLAAVGKMGYQGVELAHSDYGFDGPAWRKLLDQNGLKVCGMHTTLPKIEGDAFKRMIDFQQAIGNKRLILAAVPKKYLESAAGMLDTAKLLNDLADKLKPYGMQIGYHCHAGDFKPAEGKIPWEVLGKNTRSDVILQLDIGNCLGAGGDYLAMLREFPGRTVSVHLKEFGGKPGAVIGEGTIQWPEVFRICESTGGTKWYVVEHEAGKGPEALDAVDRCLKNLRKMGK